MRKPYLILVAGRLWERKLTHQGAEKVVAVLRERGLQAVLAYESEGMEYEYTQNY